MSSVAQFPTHGKTVSPTIRPTEHHTLFEVQSFTNPDVWYHVFLNGVEAKCTCKAFAKRKGEEDCKHLKAVRRSLNGQQEEQVNHADAAMPEPDAAPPVINHEQPVPSPEELSPAGSVIPRKWIVELHGKEFIRYEGLLALAHERGLQSLSVKVLQANERLAVCEATATFKDGRTFSEIGDAFPGNVNAKVAPHFIRCAATRSKARALRDGLNIGLVAMEELAE